MTRRALILLRKLLLSLLVLGGFYALAIDTPFLDENRVSAGRGDAAGATVQAVARPGERPPATLDVGGLPLGMEQIAVEPCSSATWEPRSAGLCAGECALLAVERDAGSALISWRDEAPHSAPHSGGTLEAPHSGGTLEAPHSGGTLEAPHSGGTLEKLPHSGGTVHTGTVHTAQLRCADDGRGVLHHFWVRPELVTASGAGSLGRRPVRLDGLGWTIRLEEATPTALDELRRDLEQRGFAPLSIADPTLSADALIMLRGEDICLARRQFNEGDELLVSACSSTVFAR